MAEKRKKRRNQRGKTHILRARSFQGIFPLFPHLDLHFGKNVVFYSVSRNFCRGLVAQSVEHRPFKAGVQGSSPCQLTFLCPHSWSFPPSPESRFSRALKTKKGSHATCKPVKIKMVVGDGFEPSKAWPVDLQSTAFDRSATPPGNSTWSG